MKCVEIAKECGVKHMSLLTSSGANANSWFLYIKTKGQVTNIPLFQSKIEQFSSRQPLGIGITQPDRNCVYSFNNSLNLVWPVLVDISYSIEIRE